MKKHVAPLLFIIFYAGIALCPAFADSNSTMTSTIILSAPPSNSAYYPPEYLREYLRFAAELSRKVDARDQLRILADAGIRARLRKAGVKASHIVAAEPHDIWVRDFGVVQTRAGIFQFEYLPNYLNEEDAPETQAAFRRSFSALKLQAKQLPLVLDGGNINYNGRDAIVTTERVLTDNPERSRAEIIAFFKRHLGVKHVIILPEVAGDTTGHSDGMAKWLDERTIAVSHFENDAFRQRVVKKILAEIPTLKIIMMPYAPSDSYWKGFADASGVYVNALTTTNAMYVPQFGDKQRDAAALRVYREHVNKTVIPIRVGRLGKLGGSVRCLTSSFSR